MTTPAIQLTDEQFRRWMLPQIDAWTAKDCGLYFGVSAEQFVREISKSDGFPQPCKISQKTRLWDAEQVRRWRKRAAA